MLEPPGQPEGGHTRRNGGRIAPVVSPAPARMAIARIGGIDEQYLAAAIVLQRARGAEGSESRARTDCHDEIRIEIAHQPVIDPAKADVSRPSVLAHGHCRSEKLLAELLEP